VSLAVLIAPNPSQAQAGGVGSHFAAIAYSEQTGKYGYANGCSCREEAESKAIAFCGACDAKVVTWVQNGWVALAKGGNGAYGCAWSARCLADAGAAAVRNCACRGPCPQLVLWACSL
jgi:serine/threonine-protein kinase